jgi:hypothetical protein
MKKQHVTCYKCGQRRVGFKTAFFAWVKNKVCLEKDCKGKWICTNGFGCGKED